jgi:HD-like signal output (HDOD) protein
MSSAEKMALEIAKIKNLPPLPEASIKIISAVNDPDISVNELVEVISLSPTLMARLLGLSNSSYFGRAGQIKDLRVAIIQVLGLNLVKSLSLSIALNVELDTSQCKLFDANFFWSHALSTALVAQKIAVHLDNELMAPNIVYTSGLLLNIGLLAAVYIFPVEMNNVFANSEQTDGAVSKQMIESFGQTQYDLAGILLERWQLPKVYQNTIKEFRRPEFEGDEKILAELLELSHSIGYYIIADNNEEMPDFSYLLNKLSLSQELVDNIIAELKENKDNINELAAVIGG